MRYRAPRRVVLGVPLLAAFVVATIVPASSAVAGHGSKITISNVAFAVGHVDVTTGSSVVALTWAVTDTSPSATQLKGTVTIQQYVRRNPVGPEHTVRYSLFSEWPATVSGDPGSTVQSSTYRYDFPVRQYGSAVNRTWRVTRITAEDDAGLSTRLGGGDIARLAVTGLVDDSPPILLGMTKHETPDPIFDGGSGVSLRYLLFIDEQESGFWKGRVVLSGPDGAKATAPIRLVDRGEPWPYCGEHPVLNPSDVQCTVAVTLPAGSPSGTWTVSSVVLTNTEAVSGPAADLLELPIRVTRNDVLSASDFALTPTEVDNWREPAALTLSLRPAGARDGLTTVDVYGSGCPAMTRTPMITDGVATIELQMWTFDRTCLVDGIVLTDGAGNVAAYGSRFLAPAVNLEAATIPDTTPPVATAAHLDPTTRPLSETFYNVGVYVTVDDTTGSPISGYSVTFYDVNGVSVGGGFGGIRTDPDGVVRLLARVGPVPVGTYTAGFTLTDTAGNAALYGYPFGSNPNVRPAPSGPLVLTIVDG